MSEIIELNNKQTSKEILNLVLSSLDDDKALDIKEIDLKGKTSIADFMVIASGTSSRHVSAITENIAKKLKQNGLVPSVEGKENSDWVLIDCFDVVVHVFRPEVRDFYDVEKMWEMASQARENKEA
jgi:ribosome-associated protein